MNSFDIAIIGGGHAGVEAAWIAQSFGFRVTLITMPNVSIASTPCNPSIGGVGKGQVVREIDALGGLMGRVADYSAIQCRILNETKGPAVQSTRYQIDKDIYSDHVTKLLSELKNLDIIYDKVIRVVFNDEDNFTVDCETQSISCKKVILTAGTFLDGFTHVGDDKSKGGRLSCDRSGALDELFEKSELKTLRFKTGTPARLDAKTIDYSKLKEQGSDSRTQNFHFDHETKHRFQRQVSCFMAYTNEETLSIIRANKERSPLFNGQICGVGPRYCPSIEDKAFRYPDRNIHHVFVEPEGLSLPTMYPNGLSTSLPLDIQNAFLRSIDGLAEVEIILPGYAVEYDVIETTQLDITLALKIMPSLYFAGQINGTSGYEEAAAQGLIAGANACLSLLSLEPLVLDRGDSYIGVMIEDLVTNVRDEPYRLFTARSENRLYIREDNTIERIAPYRSSLNLNYQIDQYQQEYIKEVKLLSDILEKCSFISSDMAKIYKIEDSFHSIAELLKNPKLDIVGFLENYLIDNGLKFDFRVLQNVAINLKYKGYITRSQREHSKQKKLLSKPIIWQDLCESTNISFECRQRIEAIQPSTFSQLRNIKGIRPATLAYVAGRIK